MGGNVNEYPFVHLAMSLEKRTTWSRKNSPKGPLLMALYIGLATVWGLLMSLFVGFPNSCRNNRLFHSRQLEFPVSGPQRGGNFAGRLDFPSDAAEGLFERERQFLGDGDADLDLTEPDRTSLRSAVGKTVNANGAPGKFGVPLASVGARDLGRTMDIVSIVAVAG